MFVDFFQDLAYRALVSLNRQKALSRPPSRMKSAFLKTLAAFRWKVFRFFSLTTMSKLGSETYLGSNIVVDIAERKSNTFVRNHIMQEVKLDDAYIQRYDFHQAFPDFFSLNKAFGDQYAYLLSDVTISPTMGAMWFLDGILLQQSVIRSNFFYSFGGVIETLLPSVELKSEAPVCPLSFHSCYYHQLIEGLLPALRAKRHFPEAKFLVPVLRPPYFDGMAEFFGIESGAFIESTYPVHVAHGILVSKHNESGFVRQADVAFIRSECERRLKDNGYGRKIYISRSTTANRRICNELEFERELLAIGFEICHFENMPFAEQMDVIHSAAVVVAPHGSGEANMIAARSRTKWIEILQDDWFSPLYARLAIQCGLDYQYFEMRRQGKGFLIPISTIVKAL